MPKQQSWLDLVELVFSILTRRLQPRGEFTSRNELIDKIIVWIADFDCIAKPFGWTFNGASVEIASEMWGLASIGITLNTYAHVLPHMQQEAIDRLEAA